MQTAKFEGPDGAVVRIEVPDGTTPEEARALYDRQLVESKKKVFRAIRRADAASDSEAVRELANDYKRLSASGRESPSTGPWEKYRQDTSLSELTRPEGFDWAGARKAGYSDAEIADHLREKAADLAQRKNAELWAQWNVAGLAAFAGAFVLVRRLRPKQPSPVVRRVNVFEGARRVTLLAVALSVVGWGFYVFGGGLSVAAERANESFLAMLGWLTFLFGGALAVGWIVRGVLGIPSGSDFRPAEVKSPDPA